MVTTAARRRKWTTETIVLAAQYEFAENGYHSASYGRIAARAGLSKGLVSHYFCQKKDLAVAVIESAYAARREMFPPPEESPLFGVDGIIVCTEQMAESLDDSSLARATVRLLLERDTIDAELPDHYGLWIDKFEQFLDEAKGDGTLHNDVVSRVEAELLVALFVGFRSLSAEKSGILGLTGNAVSAVLAVLGRMRVDSGAGNATPANVAASANHYCTKYNK